MATMPLGSRLSYINNRSSFFNTYYKERNNFRKITHRSNNKYISNITNDHTFLLIKCKTFKSGTKIKEYKDSTVATYGSKVHLAATNETNNFEYDDNEWDVGIGNLIIDLDADIEKTRDDKLKSNISMASTPSTCSSAQIETIDNLTYSNTDSLSYSNSVQLSSSLLSSSVSSTVTCSINTECHNLNNSSVSTSNSSQVAISNVKSSSTSNDILGTEHCGKMSVEHSATVDKGLKMKIKRTKPGTKTCEAKHEIVKSSEINKSLANQGGHIDTSGSSISNSLSTLVTCTNNSLDNQTLSSLNKSLSKTSHSSSTTLVGTTVSTFLISKRIAGSYRREKVRDKHEKLQNKQVSQSSQLEVNGSIKHIAQNPSLEMPVSTITTTVTTINPSSLNSNVSLIDLNVSSNIHTNSLSSAPSSPTSIIVVGNNENQSATINSVFDNIPTTVDSSETSNCSLTYCLSNVLPLCSTVSAKQPNFENVHTSNNTFTLDAANDSPPAKRLKTVLDSDPKNQCHQPCYKSRVPCQVNYE